MLNLFVFNDKILEILLKIIVKIFDPFVLKIYLFIVSYNDCTILSKYSMPFCLISEIIHPR